MKRVTCFHERSSLCWQIDLSKEKKKGLSWYNLFTLFSCIITITIFNITWYRNQHINVKNGWINLQIIKWCNWFLIAYFFSICFWSTCAILQVNDTFFQWIIIFLLFSFLSDGKAIRSNWIVDYFCFIQAWIH